MRMVFYRWPDGSFVDLDVDDGRTFLWVSLFDQEEVTNIKISVRRDDLRLHAIGRHILSSSLQRKMTGLALDLGLEHVHSVYRPDLFYSTWTQIVIAPWRQVVSDETWENRERELESAGSVKKDFLLPGLDIEIQRPPREYVIRYGLDFHRTVQGDSKRAALRELIRDLFIIPESEIESWEEQNVDRGSFVGLAPEEVELYRLLGQPLPLWWPPSELHSWMEERPGRVR